VSDADASESSDFDSRSFLSKNRHRTKECALCGKKESSHWALHWKTKHKDKIPQERKLNEPLKGEPY